MNILITGGASGLGEAITKALAVNSEHFVYFTYCKSKEAASKLEDNYTNVKAIYCDFNKEESVTDLLKKMEDLKLNVLINNALPMMSTSHYHKSDSDDFLASFKTNVIPFIKISQKAIQVFRKVKFGKVITILSSFIINKPPLGLSLYVAEKNYILSLSKSIATENASFNISSNCISPSFMLTDLNRNIDERIIDDMKLKHPLKKILTIEETTEAVVFYVNATQHINGTNIIINSASDVQ